MRRILEPQREDGSNRKVEKTAQRRFNECITMVIKSRKIKMGGACGICSGEKCINFGWYISLRNI
jgi:hypothetical protein